MSEGSVGSSAEGGREGCPHDSRERKAFTPSSPALRSAPHRYSSTVALIDKRSIAAHNLRANHIHRGVQVKDATRVTSYVETIPHSHSANWYHSYTYSTHMLVQNRI